MKLFFTGGCGFVGSAVVRRAVALGRHEIVNIDKMTYGLRGRAGGSEAQPPPCPAEAGYLRRGCHARGVRRTSARRGVVKAICAILDAKLPSRAGARERLITFVRDRPGHDNRYEIDPASAKAALDWRAEHDFERGLAATIDWYLENQARWEGIRAQKYHGQRLGTTA